MGFGLMRLPTIGEDIDVEQVKEMVDLFLQAGFTYFDTAYGYFSGKSEAAIKEALVDRYPRESFQLATKLPAWAGPKTAEEAQNMFWTSLERTGAGYFDYYLLHNLGDTRSKAFDDFGIWDFLQEQKEKGLIRHLGFSIHDKADVLDDVLTRHPEMEFVQLQINYADWESHSIQSRKCYETALRHGKPVIIMEPVKGRALANLPEPLADILKAADPEVSQSSWAMRYAASLDNIITVLSGMSSVEQMKDNLKTMSNFKPLSDEERAVIGRVVDGMNRIPKVDCTNCRYCVKGCPQSINIPAIFRVVNEYLIYNNIATAKGGYNWATNKGGKASSCVRCGHCEMACPQHLSIIYELERAAERFED